MKKKFVRILIFTSVLSCLPLSGCRNTHDILEQTTKSATQKESLELSDDEMKFLCSKYIDEDRIKEGKLYSYQEEALSQYRAVRDYLESKYPGTEFVIYALQTINETSNETGTAGFYVSGEQDDNYDIRITKENNSYKVADNYANNILGETYADKVKADIESEFPGNIEVYVQINGFLDENQDGRATGEEAFAVENKKDVYIYADAEPDAAKCREIADKVEKYFRHENQYISCVVYFAPEVTGKCTKLRELRDYISSLDENDYYSTSFNIFDGQ